MKKDGEFVDRFFFADEIKKARKKDKEKQKDDKQKKDVKSNGK